MTRGVIPDGPHLNARAATRIDNVPVVDTFRAVDSGPSVRILVMRAFSRMPYQVPVSVDSRQPLPHVGLITPVSV